MCVFAVAWPPAQGVALEKALADPGTLKDTIGKQKINEKRVTQTLYVCSLIKANDFNLRISGVINCSDAFAHYFQF